MGGSGVLFVGIDLAERHSAAVAVDADLTPLLETILDTGPKENVPNPFIKAERLLLWWENLLQGVHALNPDEVIWVIEDVAPHMMDSKPVLKLQGSLIGYMAMKGITAHVITAKTWQYDFGWKSKQQNGDSKKWATALCEQAEYVPGCTMPEGTKILAKPKTDLRDAYLLARWLRWQCLAPELDPFK